MTRYGIILLLLSSLTWGQAAKPQSAPAPELKARPAGSSNPATATDSNAPSAASVAPDAPVITIDGLCENQPADKAASPDCKTVVTRQQFDAVANAVAPNLPPTGRKQLANRYAAVLVMSIEAHKEGLDQGPRYDEMIKLARMQASAQELQRAWQEKASQVSDKEIEDYYHQNSPAYDEAGLERVFIPRTKQAEGAKPKAAKTAATAATKAPEDSAAAMKKEADQLRTRAAAGEDFSKLQREANEFAGLKTQTPDTGETKVKRNGLPPNESAVFDLKPGDVSAVMEEPTGYVFYKVKSKGTATLESVREDIRKTLVQQHVQEAAKNLQKFGEPKLDEAYFGPTQPSPMAPSLGRPPAGKPASQPD